MMATSWKTLNVLKIFLWIHSWVKRMVTARVYRAQHKKCTSSTCCLLNIYSPCNWQVRRWRLGDSVLQEVDEPHHLGILRLVFHQWPSPHSDDISNSVQKTSTSNGRGVTIKLYQELLFEMNLPDLSQLLPILCELLLGRRITTMKHLAIREHIDKLFETCEEYHISCCELLRPAPLLATVISNYFILQLLLPGVLL